MPFIIFGARSLRRTEGNFEKRSAKRQFHMTAFVLHLSFHTIFEPKPSNLTATFSQFIVAGNSISKAIAEQSCTALLWRLRVMNDFLKLQNHHQHPAFWLTGGKQEAAHK